MLIKINLISKFLFLTTLLISLNSFSQVTSCSECDQCGTSGSTCNLDPRFNGDLQLCYETLPECGGIPINDYSYLLTIIGFSILFIVIFRRRRKLSNISNSAVQTKF